MWLITNRWTQFLFLLALLLLSVFGLHSEGDIRQRIRFAAFDTYQSIKPREYQGDVVIIDYDDESLGIVGQWPWPRTKTAQIVSNLTALGARAIAFDGVLAEPDQNSPGNIIQSLPDDLRQRMASAQNLPDYDQELAAAIKTSGIFVAAFTHGSNMTPVDLKKQILTKEQIKQHFLESAQSFKSGTAQFLPQFLEGAAGNGSFMANADIDGLIRGTNLVFTDGKTLFPSLSLEAIRIAEDPRNVYKIGQPEGSDFELASDYQIVLGPHVVPIDDRGRFWVYYKRSTGQDYVPAFKVIDPQYFDEIHAQVQGKIALIGSSAEGLKDLRATPVNKFLPGVEIHANVIEQILNGQYIFRPAQAGMIEDQFIFLTGLMIIVFAPFIGAVWLGSLCFGVIGLSFFGSWQGFLEHGILIDPVYPGLAIFVIFSLSTLLTYLRVEAEKRQVRSAFGLYISPDFMKELTRNPGKLKLGGEIRDLTIMFTDIRNFTTISEGLKPEELIQLMNDFLTPMSDLVMQNRGTIDKYMGDAMMAFWNAPLDDPDHARHACIAALGMQAALAPINEAVARRAAEDGRTPVLLQTGIGINSGPCAVGNMGSRQRFAYSTLGDAVNMASRLEGQTKFYGVNILMGARTQTQVPDFATLEIDLIQVKGKTKAEHIYVLLGGPETAARAEFTALKNHHDAMIASYRAGNFKDAGKALEESLKHASEFRLETLYALYQARLVELMANPPAEGWDGVYIAKTK
jgi:adenylate cyclase